MNDLQKLTVLFNDASAATFTDNTQKLFDFARDAVTMPLETTPDYIYIGRRKPWNSVFVEMGTTVNSVASVLTAEYYNEDDAAWTALPLLVEDTRGFSRSGFIKWATPRNAALNLLEGEVAINSVTQYWIRIQSDANITAGTSFKGVGLVYSDDQDLKREDPKIYSLLPTDENDTALTSHILSHVTARDAIIQQLRTDGKFKLDVTTQEAEDLDEYDILDIDQVREASKFKAISHIYFNASDSPEDIYWQKFKKYEGKYDAAMNMVLLTIDKNDDGNQSGGEKGLINNVGSFTRQ
jgi:hypothetical protein